MTEIISIAGILAALVLFRWARTLAMIALLITLIYFAHAFNVWNAGH